MKYIKSFESKKHKYKVGDWVLVEIPEEDFSESGEILDTDYLVGKDERLSYTIDFFAKVPEELYYMQYGDENSTKCLVEHSEIKRKLNKKEIEIAKLEKTTRKYNI